LLYRERLVSSAWLGLLVAPPVLVALGLLVLPWTVAVDLKIAQPIVELLPKARSPAVDSDAGSSHE